MSLNFIMKALKRHWGGVCDAEIERNTEQMLKYREVENDGKPWRDSSLAK